MATFEVKESNLRARWR